MVIILAGTIGRSGLGGQAWAVMQYLAGFRDLGHDVFYLEDCGETSEAVDWERGETTYDLDYPAAFVKECLDTIGLADRWTYRAGSDSRGMSVSALADACSEAELLIMRAVPMSTGRPEYERPGRRVFIDVDPGNFFFQRPVLFNQPFNGSYVRHVTALASYSRNRIGDTSRSH